MVNLTLITAFKPHTQKLYILRHCTNFDYIHFVHVFENVYINMYTCIYLFDQLSAVWVLQMFYHNLIPLNVLLLLLEVILEIGFLLFITLLLVSPFTQAGFSMFKVFQLPARKDKEQFLQFALHINRLFDFQA